jgi:hypothetical protein
MCCRTGLGSALGAWGNHRSATDQRDARHSCEASAVAAERNLTGAALAIGGERTMTNLIFVAALLEALDTAAAVIQGIGFLAAASALIGACISGFGERSISGLKISLILAIIAGLAFLIAQAFFSAGGWTSTITPGALN